jgi:hypothetical protein
MWLGAYQGFNQSYFEDSPRAYMVARSPHVEVHFKLSRLGSRLVKKVFTKFQYKKVDFPKFGGEKMLTKIFGQTTCSYMIKELLPYIHLI